VSIADLPVWLEAVLQGVDLPVAADWLKEQPSSTIVAFLEALRAHYPVLLIWSDSEAYWSRRLGHWLFTKTGAQRVDSWLEFDVLDFDRIQDEEDIELAYSALAHDGNRWVLDNEDMPFLNPLPPMTDVARLLRVGTSEGKILSGQQALDWYSFKYSSP
jgi:hypothetical protein